MKPAIRLPPSAFRSDKRAGPVGKPLAAPLSGVWLDEIERRLSEVDAGGVMTIDAADVFGRLWRKYAGNMR